MKLERAAAGAAAPDVLEAMRVLLVTPAPTIPADPGTLVVAPQVTAALVALFGVLIAQIVIWVQNIGAGKRWRREQALGMVRWAAELAADEDPAKATLGLETLNALGNSSLLVKQDQALLDAALLVATREPYDGGSPADEDQGQDTSAQRGKDGWLRRLGRRLRHPLGCKSEQLS